MLRGTHDQNEFVVHLDFVLQREIGREVEAEKGRLDKAPVIRDRKRVEFSDYEKKDECWDKLQEIMEAYKKEGKSVYTPTFIEDNEDKVKALQEQYEFTYTIEER